MFDKSLQLLQSGIFFAISHDKSPCDTDGGTTKQLAARAGFQHPHNKQILAPKGFYESAQENIHGIKYFYVSEVHITETKLQEHFSNVCR
jgi:hypothetical protein